MRFNEEMDKYLFMIRNMDGDKMPDAYRYAKKILADIIQNDLTELQRECTYRYYFERKSTNVIAREIGTSRANVSKHIRKSRKKIYDSLKYVLLYATGIKISVEEMFNQ